MTAFGVVTMYFMYVKDAVMLLEKAQRTKVCHARQNWLCRRRYRHQHQIESKKNTFGGFPIQRLGTIISDFSKQ
jgi:hypothetical protein